jgi:hypothetical protein
LQPVDFLFSKGFSKRSKKYNERNCYNFWKSFKNPEHGNLLTIKSLVFWAKTDNPKEYAEFKQKKIKENINNNLSDISQ